MAAYWVTRSGRTCTPIPQTTYWLDCNGLYDVLQICSSIDVVMVALLVYGMASEIK